MDETLLDVRGMTCGSCVRHVRGALLELDGVEAVDVRLAEGKVKVRHDAPVARLVEALGAAGYPARPA